MALSSNREDTPLLGHESTPKRRQLFNPYRRVLFATFLLATTFWFTFTPIIYAFRVFSCQEYYADPAHPPYTGVGDACAIPAIDASSAKDISIMMVLGTLSGGANLLLTTWQIRHWGLRAAIVQQTFWPALRNLTQIYATFVGGRQGITIMQITQSITIFGGGAGYMLSANTYIPEVVEPIQRTAAFGVLAGMTMLGSALGFIAGGLAYDLINISAPFEITFGLLVASTLYSAALLPYIPPSGDPPNTIDSSAPSKLKPLSAFIDSVSVFQPSEYADGSGKYWGLTLLGLGAFAGGLATQYVPMMLQLTATNQYGYKPSDNGFLLSGNSLSRAIFLTFAFPRIISAGRAWIAPQGTSMVDNSPTAGTRSTAVEADNDSGTVPGIPTDPRAFEATIVPSAEGATEEPPLIPTPTDKVHESGFDLIFLRWSILVDAILTAGVGFSSQSWHMVAAALILPLASGTAPACKGVLMEMVPEGRRADALAGLSFLETLTQICTVTLFGSLFAYLSDIGRPQLVFFCNAALAVLASVVLFLVRFPKRRLV
ncbi:hypothetical protein R3P38DRAFT_3070040 [Favolaschia claudopus]|uniref:Uncharacterized protein n=1 Tax=Favolaschia claudopus TaxID=2862362 RepID=A0AAW0A048_9AGAR